MIGRGEGPIGKRHPDSSRPQHIERLWGRDLVNQMQPNEELRLSGREYANRVKIPDLLE